MSTVPKYHLKKAPLVSVVMPTYNRYDVICQAVDSVLSQTYRKFELIIVDDGSSDNTEEMLKQRYSYEWNKRLKYFKTDRKGVSHARNFGIEKSEGDYVAYLDTDNTWRNNYLHTMLHLLQTSFSKCAYSAIAVDNQVDKMVFTLFQPLFEWNSLYEKNFIDLNGFVHHKDLFEELGGFDQQMTRLVDWDLILRYTNKYEPRPVPYILVDYSVSCNVNHITTSESYEENRKLIEAKF